MKFSIIIPVFNRPDEINDLIQSIVDQKYRDIEIIVIEDGSSITSNDIINSFKNKINLQYHEISNQGPGLARNHGVKFANAEWIIFFDSDCTIPKNYFYEVDEFLKSNTEVDFFGGPDKSNKSFSFLQKAINYSMTSMLTTGGIRGSKYRVDKFLPRSFNMGMKKKNFLQVGGFSSMRFGEDLDLTYRLLSSGAKSSIIKTAYVYHKRRNNLIGFFNQIFSSGNARVKLNQKHKGTFRFFHLLPSLFFIFFVFMCLLLLFKIDFNFIFLIQFIYGIYFMLIFLESSILNKNPLVGLLSVITTFTQFFAYGTGYLKAWIKNYL
tara:strand:- start:453 stop:1418 length:966 start_codon:yes stop_codon:yes gene_type:complete